MMKKAFVKLGSPMWYWDKAVYAYPIRMAIKLNIPLVVYGENIAYEYGGVNAKETPSALDQINNDVVKPVPLEEWLDDDITMGAMQNIIYPSEDEIKTAQLNPIYLSYFLPWDGFKNMSISKNYGFKSLGDTKEWVRSGFVEDYDQIDSPAYLIHPWLKYPKYGHARATDVCSSLIRLGYMTREYGKALVRQYDWQVDPWALQDFLKIIGENEIFFWKILDSMYNREIFYKKDNLWYLKNPIWEEGNERQSNDTSSAKRK